MTRGAISVSLWILITYLVALSTSRYTYIQPHEEINVDTYEKANKHTENSIEPPLRVGSFNIQTLGKRKLKDEDIMITVAKIVHRYDVIFIMELMTDDNRLFEKLLFDINKFSTNGAVYNMTRSGDRIGNEVSAFIYKTRTVRLLRTEPYRDPTNFYRTPFFALFETPTLRDMKKFGMIGLHVKPSEAVREINALANVYDYVIKKYKIEDILLMGDFNADCSYVSEKDWDNISLWTRPEFTWAIGNDMDTTTNHKSCALDRFVYAGENLNAGIITSSVKIFNFQKEFYLTIDEVRAVSDHWPIELLIRGKTSDTVANHLLSDSCFKIYDNRPPTLNKTQIQQSLKSLQLNFTESEGAYHLRKSEYEVENLLRSLTEIRKKFPEILSQELVDAALYKYEYNGLFDESSTDDQPDPFYTIEVVAANSSTTLTVCKATTVN